VQHRKRSERADDLRNAEALKRSPRSSGNLLFMALTIAQKLERKDTEYRRFLELVSRAVNETTGEAARRHLMNQFTALLNGGKTFARADEHILTGIHNSLLEQSDLGASGKEVCRLAEAWERKRGLY
jgi:hypothetical protein